MKKILFGVFLLVFGLVAFNLSGTGADELVRPLGLGFATLGVLLIIVALMTGRGSR